MLAGHRHEDADHLPHDVAYNMGAVVILAPPLSASASRVLNLPAHLKALSRHEHRPACALASAQELEEEFRCVEEDWTGGREGVESLVEALVRVLSESDATELVLYCLATLERLTRAKVACAALAQNCSAAEPIVRLLSNSSDTDALELAAIISTRLASQGEAGGREGSYAWRLFDAGAVTPLVELLSGGTARSNAVLVVPHSSLHILASWSWLYLGS